MIRAGETRDIEYILGMACEFWEHTAYSEPACSDTIRDMIELCINEHLMSVIDLDGELIGFAAGITGPLLGNRSALTGTELAWWVDTNHRKGSNGVKLLKHIEAAAKAAGVKYWTMAYMESSMPETIKCLYEKMGYTQIEVVYQKTL